ncbi:DUF2525 domain-containing protein [Candidatus Pantoea deserta]|uniref:DUF2525 domain-containing protein n=1 Tax=Candidatus Pantoea deserta TaxID=1869313 RepID=A0A3N4P9B7_9GAMM|nr:DUF2525 domain-containing protein [Pantoea deserta]RPE02929.1 DUF2525 domain-containing protein [Pantoea deserta]
MVPTDERAADLQPSARPDVDSLLETIQRHTPEPLKNFTEADNSRHLRTGGRAWGSSIELADEYELDIRDCSCNEMNR